MSNQGKGNIFRFLKINEHNEPLSNGEYILIDSLNYSTHSAISDFTGEVKFTNLNPGIYTLQEIIPPTNCCLNRDIFIVRIDVNGQITINGIPEFNFKFPPNNEYRNGSHLNFIVINEQYIPLANAQFELKNIDNNEQYNEFSNENGLISFENIPSGIYKLHQINAPDGYKLSDIMYKIEIDDEGYVKVNNRESYWFKYIINYKEFNKRSEY